MAQTEKELEKQLLEAGNKLLLSPPSSVPELLSLLDRVEGFLTRVEQSPSESMNKSLSPTIKAIISDDLLKHSNVDVRVAVASCISEITRITAPDAPYEDDQMKDVFQLIVSSFEKIDDKSSPSYIKRTTILETVAKVRSCVVMLDLECDGLILEMFQHFLRSIRDDHPENVFSSMETIMTLVLEESEDVSLDLVSSMLDALKIENKEALPIARQLAEKVIEKCASKLKPYLLPAMKSRGASLNDYSKVVANVCQVPPEAVEPCDGDAASKNTPVDEGSDFGDAPGEKADEVAMETLDDAPPSEEIGATMGGSPKSVVSNGTIQKEIEDTSAVTDNTEEDHDNCDGVQTDPEPSKASVESLHAGENAKSKSKPVKSNKRKGRKTLSLKSSSKTSGSTVDDDKNETDKLPEQQEGSKEVDGKHNEDAIAAQSGPARNNGEPEAHVSLEKTSEAENENAEVTLPSPTGSAADKSHSKEHGEGKKGDEVVQESVPMSNIDSKKESDSKKASEGTNVSEPNHKGTGKKKDEVVQASAPVSDIDSKKESDSKKASEETNVSESQLHERTGKKASSEPDKEERDASKKENEDTANLAAKSARQSVKKVEVGSSQSEDKKNRGQGKATSSKDLARTPSEDEEKTPLAKSIGRSTKDEIDAEKTSKMSFKRKRSAGKEKASGTKDHGEELVGSKIKVWWPDDKRFYSGVVKSFDSVKMKHKVLYDDGDVEILKLAKEKWELIEGNAIPDQECASGGENPDEISETPKGKKVKTGEGLRTKRGKVETTAKKGASSSKSKATPKSGQKQKDDSSKVDGKSKEESSKSVAKSSQGKGKSKEESSKSVPKPDQEKAGKSKDSKAGNKSSNEAPKPAGKSKDENSDPSKGTTTKAKQDTFKGAPKSKGKSPKTNTKTNTSETAKPKPGSSSPKSKEAEEKEKSPEPDEAPAPETAAKGKSPSASKTQKKGGKKRKRGGRS